MRIDDNRIYKNDMSKFIGSQAPPLGTYDPVNPMKSGFEEKAKLSFIRASRWNLQQKSSSYDNARKEAQEAEAENSKAQISSDTNIKQSSGVKLEVSTDK